MLRGEDPIFQVKINPEDLLERHVVTNHPLAVTALNLLRVFNQRCSRLVKLRRPFGFPVLCNIVSELIEPDQAPKLLNGPLLDL